MRLRVIYESILQEGLGVTIACNRLRLSQGLTTTIRTLPIRGAYGPEANADLRGSRWRPGGASKGRIGLARQGRQEGQRYPSKGSPRWRETRKAKGGQREKARDGRQALQPRREASHPGDFSDRRGGPGALWGELAQLLPLAQRSGSGPADPAHGATPASRTGEIGGSRYGASV